MITTALEWFTLEERQPQPELECVVLLRPVYHMILPPDAPAPHLPFFHVVCCFGPSAHEMPPGIAPVFEFYNRLNGQRYDDSRVVRWAYLEYARE